MSWEFLVEAYRNSGIALVLGAGVSYASNIPKWDDLLRELVETHVDIHSRTLYDDLRAGGMSLPAIASLIEDHCGNRGNFIEAMRNVLYADFPFYGTRFDKENHWDFVRFVRTGRVPKKYGQRRRPYRANQTLRSVGALCLVKEKYKTSSRFVANPKIHAVATLNVDALLQSYISTFTTRHLLRTVEQSSADRSSEQIPLYHLHGYLHYRPGRRESFPDSLEHVVLTEQDYYDFFNRPNSVFNYTFLYLLREYNCLFIGLSMQDENIKRMLHYSKLERLEAAGRKMGLSPEAVKRGLLTQREKAGIRKQVARHFAILSGSELSKRTRSAWEVTLGALGVHILWVDGFDEIPLRLGELYESDPAQQVKWESVYGR